MLLLRFEGLAVRGEYMSWAILFFFSSCCLYVFVFVVVFVFFDFSNLLWGTFGTFWYSRDNSSSIFTLVFDRLLNAFRTFQRSRAVSVNLKKFLLGLVHMLPSSVLYFVCYWYYCYLVSLLLFVFFLFYQFIVVSNEKGMNEWTVSVKLIHTIVCK